MLNNEVQPQSLRITPIAEDEVFTPASYKNEPLPNFLISNYGRLYSIKRQKLNSPYFCKFTDKAVYKITDKGSPCTDRYTTYMLGTDGKRDYISAHRLVAFAFIHNPNPESFNTVNHKDENKLNNYYKNLEWCMASYNKQYNGALFKSSNTTKTES